jgi:hypothetical protein
LGPTTSASFGLGVTGLMKAALGLRVDFFFAVCLAPFLAVFLAVFLFAVFFFADFLAVFFAI